MIQNSEINQEFYKPKNKAEREARRRVWERFETMRDDQIRKEAEEQWERADKQFMQWQPEREYGDWRSHITLPDAFGAVQSHMQETIDRRGRPYLEQVDASDYIRESFSNHIFNFSMDRTGFDLEQFKAKQSAAIRGTAFVAERYRFEKREVKDLDSIDKDGKIKYTKREIIDADDTYTEYVENDTLYWDPAATHESRARDAVEREVVDWDEFQRVYKMRADFMNIEKVPKAGAITQQVLFFKKAEDMSDNDVEILHYYNRATDSYDALANNVLIRMAPIPYKHKEIPFAVYRHYMLLGRMYGMGIPEVIYSLSEERVSLRRLQLDKQHLQVDKMFLVNDLVDIDEEEARVRPHGFMYVNTNGVPINQVIQSVEYGDTPMSYYRSEEQLLDDMRRAHGISDELQQVSSGTATQAAIAKEQAQKRINMINILADMDTLVRIGRLKWSNIQFFYPAARIEKITTDKGTKDKKSYRKIRIKGIEYQTEQTEGGTKLVSNRIDGNSGFTLDRKMAKFMEGDYEVTINADASPVLSRPLQQAKITEMLGALSGNAIMAGQVDPQKAASRYLRVFGEDPTDWLVGNGWTDDQWKQLAREENVVMSSGIPLLPTDGATQAHTEEHLNYMDTTAYMDLPQAIQDIIAKHTFGEAEKQGAIPGGAADQASQGAAGGGELPAVGVADIQPATPNGAEAQDVNRDQMGL